MSDPAADPGLSIFFSLSIDNWDLGPFTTCSGLGLDMQVNVYAEGGGGLTVYPGIGLVKYTPLSVTRPIGPYTARTMAWLQSVVNGGAASTAQLAALDPSLTPIFSWTLSGVLLSKWTGPSFDAANPQVVTETLELTYGSIMLGQS